MKGTTMKNQESILWIRASIKFDHEMQLTRLEEHLLEGKSIAMFLQSPSERALDDTLYLTRQLLKQLESEKTQPRTIWQKLFKK